MGQTWSHLGTVGGNKCDSVPLPLPPASSQPMYEVIVNKSTGSTKWEIGFEI